ncbi:ester cyclase [Nocardia sp. NPDC052278]|uniref:ester cyclase n=1 Tax=Nocardia sp. NPDC052278 TaxID=3364328 RepID=UPI0037C8D76B
MTSTDAVAKVDAVAKEYFAAVNRRDFETLTNLLAPDVVFEHESPIEGRDKIISMLQGICTAFPDLTISVTDQISREDEVVCFLLGSGTWRGEFAGVPPTGRHFAARTVDRIRFSGASIASISTVCEVLGGFSVMHQLGITAQTSEV